MTIIQGNVIRLPGVAPTALADLDQGDPTVKLILTGIRATDLSERIADEIKTAAGDQERTAHRIEDAARSLAAVAEATQDANKLNLGLIRNDVHKVATSSAETLVTVQSVRDEIQERMDSSIAAAAENIELKHRLAASDAFATQIEQAHDFTLKKLRKVTERRMELQQLLVSERRAAKASLDAAQRRRETDLTAASALADKQISELKLELSHAIDNNKNLVWLQRIVVAQVLVIALLALLILVK